MIVFKLRDINTIECIYCNWTSPNRGWSDIHVERDEVFAHLNDCHSAVMALVSLAEKCYLEASLKRDDENTTAYYNYFSNMDEWEPDGVFG